MLVMSKSLFRMAVSVSFFRPEEKARALDDVTVNISKTIENARRKDRLVYPSKGCSVFFATITVAYVIGVAIIS